VTHEKRDEEKLHLELLAAPDDTPVESEAFQNELRGVTESFRAQGIDFNQYERVFKSVGTTGWPLPDYMILIERALIPALAAACGAWVTARYGRKVRLKIGDVEAEGRTVAEIETLLQKAADFRESESRDDE
jgi:hypothetical protein